MTLAPLAIRGKVVVGSERRRGRHSRLRRRLRRRAPANAPGASTPFPAPGEPGHESWAGDSWKTGGGSTWVTGSYDPESNLVYWGVGNPGPDWNADSRAGDNLYTCSLVALDGDTGKLKWHFQFTPHDSHDWDSTHVPVLFEADVRGARAQAGGGGQSQRVLLRARPDHRRIRHRPALRQADVGQGPGRPRPSDRDSEHRAQRARARWCGPT